MKRLYNLLGIATSVIVLSVVMLVVSLASQPAQAEQQPDTLLRETIEQLLDELRSNRPKYEADKCHLYSLVNDLVLPQFAVDKTVRLILGKHFKAASPEMRSRFTDAFMKMMIRTYATAMFEYTEQGLVPPPPEILELNESAVTVLLRQRVPVAGQAPVLVDYVMWRSKDDHWRILDIRIDHVSLVMAYRLQYDPMVKAKGLEALIHRLETKIEDC
jgi:phospholipid transport system substrate-binding protein|tara:strand:+ start:230 stop:877 length:648 start_codon:yes stop_codon:yes gene_type:complete